MNELEIIYYYDQKTKNIIPFIKNKNESNNGKFIIDELSEGLNSSCEDYFVLYYIDLLKSGYSSNEIENFLNEEIIRKETNGGFKYIKSLMIQRDILREANLLLNKDKNTSGLVELYNLPSIQSSIKASKNLKLQKKKR